MNVLGISSGLHDAAAALLVDGRLAAAVEQERLSRIKHDPGFPDRAIEVCLAIAGASPSDIDLVALHEKPLDVIDRHLASRRRSGPRAARALLSETPQVVADHLLAPRRVERWFAGQQLPLPPVVAATHHTSHAAAAFYPSPFETAAILTADGVGEWATTSIASGAGAELVVHEELYFPDSLGLLYTAFTTYCGFRANSGEGELMGLAPFGEPRHLDLILSEICEVRPDGSFRLNPSYFAYQHGRTMTSSRFHRLFGGPPRPHGTQPTRREADLAASVQAATEHLLLALATRVRTRTSASSLCLGGGVALNCVANGVVLRDGPFEDVWVVPAPGDGGSALGAAYWAWHHVVGAPRPAPNSDAFIDAALGPGFTDEEIHRWLDGNGVPHETMDDHHSTCVVTAEHLAGGRTVGWFQGRMEFGPRALGNRSILADPRSPTVQRRLNGIVKERAGFRPFAPAVLAEHASEWFDVFGDSPFMTFTAQVQPWRRRTPVIREDAPLEEVVSAVRSDVPAVTHVDGSARIQTVDAQRNPGFHELLTEFHTRTGCPVLLNTSFNARDEPIVCTPADAYSTFRATGLDVLVLGRHIIVAEQ